jgi:hypothetical protein
MLHTVSPVFCQPADSKYQSQEVWITLGALVIDDEVMVVMEIVVMIGVVAVTVVDYGLWW